MENYIQYTPILLAIVGLIVMYIQSVWVRKQSAGSDKMQSISKSIKEGALAFLHAEYRLLLIFVVIASGALYGISTMVETTSWLIVPAFIIGAFFLQQQEISECVSLPKQMLVQPKPQKRVYLKHLKSPLVEVPLWAWVLLDLPCLV